MRRRLFKSKLHRATVTEANLDYEGSLTLDPDLMEAADILPHEEVHVWDVTNGARLTTYAIAGERGSRIVCVNGAGAHRVHRGDTIIVATFAEFDEHELSHHLPRIILLDEHNRVVGKRGASE